MAVNAKAFMTIYMYSLYRNMSVDKRPGYAATYDEGRESEDEYPPNILTIGDAELIENGRQDDYALRDLNFPDETGEIAFTVTLTVLHPTKQTRGHRHEKEKEMYMFQKGQGILMLNSRAIWIKPNLFCLVPKNVFHKVVNMSTSDDLVFFTFYPDKLSRPEQIRKSRLLK